MARTSVTPTALTGNGGIDIPAGTTINSTLVTNGVNIPLVTETVPSGPAARDTFLYITNTAGADKTVTVRAGVGGGATAGPAFRSGLGDLAVTCHTASGGCIIGPLESARFAQLDGSINLDFGTGLTGVLTVFQVPKNNY